MSRFYGIMLVRRLISTFDENTMQVYDIQMVRLSRLSARKSYLGKFYTGEGHRSLVKYDLHFNKFGLETMSCSFYQISIE